jgi:hypothetical protein
MLDYWAAAVRDLKIFTELELLQFFEPYCSGRAADFEDSAWP